MKFDLVQLKECLRDTIYLIPSKLSCKECGDEVDIFLDVDEGLCVCPRGHETELKEYVRFFGVIKNVSFPNQSER